VARGVLQAPPRGLPTGRTFSDDFLRIHTAALEWIRPYYDGEHLARARDWLLALEPETPEPLVVAAMLHDMERSIPGGPVFDMKTQRWDDVDYNRAHCERSAAVVAGWLQGLGAPRHFVEAMLPIREHELGGSPEGDLLQAADSLSWLEVNARVAAGWVERGACDTAKAREKLRWMSERVRLERAQATARDALGPALAELEALL
jgi:hypothetical protein